MKLSACILTLNNEVFIRPCLESVKPYVDEIVIIDSFSTDKTLEIAREYTDKIFSIEPCAGAMPRNYGIECCTGDWVFMLDSDELVSNAFKDIKSFLEITPINALVLPRFQVAGIDPLTYKSGDKYYPDYQYRLLRKDSPARYERVVHEIITDKKPILPISTHLFHFNLMLMDYGDRYAKDVKYNNLQAGAGFWRSTPFAILDCNKKDEIDENVMELIRKVPFKNDERVINF